MRMKILPSILVLTLASGAAAETFQIDANHSAVNFRIRHLVGKVHGRFDKFEGSFEYQEGKPQTWTASAIIDAASINTSNAKRDEHLRNEDFFDVAKCPKIEFVGKEVTDLKGGKAKLHGDLTMHCVTMPVVLDLEINGAEADHRGDQRAGITAKGTIPRKDFGIVYNKVLDRGGVMLGEDVEIEIDVEGVSKPALPGGEDNAKPKADAKKGL